VAPLPEGTLPPLEFFDSPVYKMSQRESIPETETTSRTVGLGVLPSRSLLALSQIVRAPYTKMWTSVIKLFTTAQTGRHTPRLRLQHRSSIAPVADFGEKHGAALIAPFEFRGPIGNAGQLAFTDSGPVQLLVTNFGGVEAAVLVIDVSDMVLVGAFGSLPRFKSPSAVATRGAMAAVSFFGHLHSDGEDTGVVLFARDGSTWTSLRVLQAPPRGWHLPCGVCISRDGKRVIVTDCNDDGLVTIFRAVDGTCIQDFSPGRGGPCMPCEVVECQEGFLLANRNGKGASLLTIADDGAQGASLLTMAGYGVHYECRQLELGLDEGEHITALALVPSLGAVLLTNWSRDGPLLCVVTTRDIGAMNTMSPIRVAWMGTVARSIQLRASLGAKRSKTDD